MALSKLFISYRSLDSGKIDTIVANLKSMGCEVWQDKHSIPGGQDWWDKIVQGITECDVFLFTVSRSSLGSPICLAEFDHAYKLNCPILAVVLEGEFNFDPQKGKDDISYWDMAPKLLQDIQCLFYKGTPFYSSFQTALNEFALNPQKRNEPKHPPHPIHGKTNIQVYQEACDLASRLKFDEAEPLFQRIANGPISDIKDDSHEWISLLRGYQDIIDADNSEYTRHQVQSLWATYKQKFPKPFITLFDPKNFAGRFTSIEQEKIPVNLSPSEISQLQLNIPTKVNVEIYSSIDDKGDDETVSNMNASRIPTTVPLVTNLDSRIRLILPKPFEWCYIPEGVIIISGKPVRVSAFMIGKYTVTNQQFDVFLKSNDGYIVGEWWGFSKQATQWRSINSTSNRITSVPHPSTPSPNTTIRRPISILPKYYPATNINWYEAMAFCQWLSFKTQLNINLANPQQWQRAARGDRKQKYSWGDVPTPERANYNTRHISGTALAEVTEYTFGASPFNVLSMCGNIHEWTNVVKTPRSDSGYRFSTPRSQVSKAYGGSYLSDASNITSSSFIEKAVETTEKDIGFRIVLNLDN